MSRFVAAIAAGLLLTASPGETGKITKEKIAWKGKDRVYYLFVPHGASPDKKLPAIVTLHGSTRNGESLLSRWKDLAEKEKIVLIGPDSADPVHWASPADGPLFLHDVVEE